MPHRQPSATGAVGLAPELSRLDELLQPRDCSQGSAWSSPSEGSANPDRMQMLLNRDVACKPSPKNENPPLGTFQRHHELFLLSRFLLPPSPSARGTPKNQEVLVACCLGHLHITGDAAASSIPHSAALQPVFTEQWDVPEKAEERKKISFPVAVEGAKL